MSSQSTEPEELKLSDLGGFSLGSEVQADNDENYDGDNSSSPDRSWESSRQGSPSFEAQTSPEHGPNAFATRGHWLTTSLGSYLSSIASEISSGLRATRHIIRSTYNALSTFASFMTIVVTSSVDLGLQAYRLARGDEIFDRRRPEIDRGGSGRVVMSRNGDRWRADRAREVTGGVSVARPSAIQEHGEGRR